MRRFTVPPFAIALVASLGVVATATVYLYLKPSVPPGTTSLPKATSDQSPVIDPGFNLSLPKTTAPTTTKPKVSSVVPPQPLPQPLPYGSQAIVVPPQPAKPLAPQGPATAPSVAPNPVNPPTAVAPSRTFTPSQPVPPPQPTPERATGGSQINTLRSIPPAELRPDLPEPMELIRQRSQPSRSARQSPAPLPPVLPPVTEAPLTPAPAASPPQGGTSSDPAPDIPTVSPQNPLWGPPATPSAPQSNLRAPAATAQNPYLLSE